MWVIGGVLIYLAIKKEMEPTLLLPMGFGTILVNLPTANPEGGVNHVIDALPIMGYGMLGIFVVTGIIIGVVYLLKLIPDKK